jgi:hypothetical protein
VLRGRNPALVLCFLHEAFKADHYLPVMANSQLVAGLADFLETWDSAADETDLTSVVASYEDKAVRFVKDWVREGYLTLYTNDVGDDLHSLTPDMETVLDWVASLMQKRSIIGTESRFLDIVQKLRDLVQNTSEDWRTKVAELEAQKQAIDKQIRELTLTQTVQTFADYQVQERFQEVNVVARSLMRDFREVEERFQQLYKNISHKHAAANQTKGGLLGFALDALDELRQTPEGLSFEGFYQHLTDPNQKAELDELIRRVFDLLTERGIRPDDTFVRKIKFYLHTEGQKVNDSFYVLARKLERIISEKSVRDRRKSLTLIHEIRALAFAVLDDPPTDEVFLELDGRADYLSTEPVVSLQEKDFRITPRALSIADTESADGSFDTLLNQPVIDKSVLLANVNYLLRSQSQVTLHQVVNEFGLKYGLSELMAYGSLAAASTKHLINDKQRDQYSLPNNRKTEFPEVTFCR